RLLPYLEREGITYIVYNASGPTNLSNRVLSVASNSRSWFLRYLLTAREPVVYIMTNQWPVWAGSWILSRVRGKKVVLAFHGEAVTWALENGSRLRRVAIEAGLRAADALVAVNTHISDVLAGIDGCAEKTHILPAFIPPAEGDDDERAIPEEIRRFANSHDPTLLAIGAPVLEQGIDLYGIDMTLDLVDTLRSDYPKIGVIWALLEFIGSRPEYAEKMRTEVQRRGLEDHWLFIPPQEIFYPLYGLADLFVRPTSSDGDAISVRESLHFGLPLVASDAIPRPEGVTTFETRNAAAFERSVRATLQNLEAEKRRLAGLSGHCTVEEETALLRNLVEDSRP
ncbi:MAG: glycosyltransferase family 4 protein, partial [Myxococcota bacterium]